MEERWQEKDFAVFNLKESDVYLFQFAFHPNQKVLLHLNQKVLHKYVELFAGWGAVCGN